VSAAPAAGGRAAAPEDRGVRGEARQAPDFKASLEERYGLAIDRQDGPARSCATFPASCGYLPVQIEELASPIAVTPSPAQGRHGVR